MGRWYNMADTEIVFERTCNYWIDAGIVGLYDTLNKPVPNSKMGEWSKTIKSYSEIDVNLTPDKLLLSGEESQLDMALSYSLERIRTTLYDVSTEKQINNQEGILYGEKDGIVHFPMVNPLITAQLVLKSPRYKDEGDSSKLPADLLEELKNCGGIRGKKQTYQTRKNSCFPFYMIDKKIIFSDDNNIKNTDNSCVSCGTSIISHSHNQAKKWFSGESKNFMPFVEGREANRTFHSFHQVSQKCWKCGFMALFSPLLLFFRQDGNDTYYILPHIPGNLLATRQLHLSLSGKRGLSRVIGAEHTTKNYESSFNRIPKGTAAFTLSFYYDLCERLLPKTNGNLMEASQKRGLIDEYGSIFQSALFLKRDSGQKSFILREVTIDKSAYFIKLFEYLKKHLDNEGKSNLLFVLHSLIERVNNKGNQLQPFSVIRAFQAMTEGKHVYRFLLPILSSDLKQDVKRYEVYNIINLFQKYDQWLFKKEDKIMSDIVEQARNSGWHLSQGFWKKQDWDKEEIKNLLKRYYYSIERAPSPVKFLEQIRHAYKKVDEEIPKEMLFHKADGSDDVKKFEVYRVYFLAGMLNGLINKNQKSSKEQQQAN